MLSDDSIKASISSSVCHCGIDSTIKNCICFYGDSKYSILFYMLLEKQQKWSFQSINPYLYHFISFLLNLHSINFNKIFLFFSRLLLLLLVFFLFVLSLINSIFHHSNLLLSLSNIERLIHLIKLISIFIPLSISIHLILLFLLFKYLYNILQFFF